MQGYEVDVGGDDFASTGGGTVHGGIGTGSVNTAVVAEDSHNLLAFSTSLGTVEFWDSQSRSRVGVLATPVSSIERGGPLEVTALKFHQSGLTLATGSSTGLVHLYNLQSLVLMLKKDQGYDYLIQTLTFLTSSTTS